MIDIETMDHTRSDYWDLFSDDELKLFGELDINYISDSRLTDGIIGKYHTYWLRFRMDMPIPLRKHLLRKLVKECKAAGVE